MDEGWEETVSRLTEYDIPFAPTRIVDNAAAAVDAADEIGYPVVCKLNPLQTAHKSDVGGVKPDLDSPDAVRHAFDELAAIDGNSSVLVQKMVTGSEFLIGLTDDPDFGPIMLFGPGGVFVELFDDFAYRALPVTESMAMEMIEETAAGRLLEGYRSYPAGDKEALARVISNVSRVYTEHDVTELEFNPIIVTEDGPLVVDIVVE
ncbi:acetate--CoA ligase family protein [Saliphagus sp. GCM10025308]